MFFNGEGSGGEAGLRVKNIGEKWRNLSYFLKEYFF